MYVHVQALSACVFPEHIFSLGNTEGYARFKKR